MAKTITIRNIPEETRNELAARAAREGQSLQEFLRGQLIALADRPDNMRLLEEIRARKRRTDSRLSADRILALRDADRR